MGWACCFKRKWHSGCAYVMMIVLIEGKNSHLMTRTNDGTGSWRDFLHQFKNCAEANHWTEKTKVVLLRHSLVGQQAQPFAKILGRAAGVILASWRKLIKHMGPSLHMQPPLGPSQRLVQVERTTVVEPDCEYVLQGTTSQVVKRKTVGCGSVGAAEFEAGVACPSNSS